MINLFDISLASLALFLLSADIFLRLGMYYGVRTIFG